MKDLVPSVDRETKQLLSESAWYHLVEAYSSFSFDEAYFQGLCLMVQLDFAGMDVRFR